MKTDTLTDHTEIEHSCATKAHPALLLPQLRLWVVRPPYVLSNVQLLNEDVSHVKNASEEHCILHRPLPWRHSSNKILAIALTNSYSLCHKQNSLCS
jgi:hypothetical protein